MFTGMLHTHVLASTLFVMIFLIKNILLFTSPDALDKFTAKMKMLQNIVTVLFLVTGIYLAFNSGIIDTWFWVKLVCIAVVIPMAIIGFKRKSKVLAPFSFILLLYIYGISETKSPVFKTKSHASSYEGVAPEQLGFEIYKAECNACHGPDGKMGLSGSKDLTLSILTDTEISTLIKEGKNMMPPFGKKLNDEQITAVSQYVMDLRKGGN